MGIYFTMLMTKVSTDSCSSVISLFTGFIEPFSSASHSLCRFMETSFSHFSLEPCFLVPAGCLAENRVCCTYSTLIITPPRPEYCCKTEFHYFLSYYFESILPVGKFCVSVAKTSCLISASFCAFPKEF